VFGIPCDRAASLRKTWKTLQRMNITVPNSVRWLMKPLAYAGLSVLLSGSIGCSVFDKNGRGNGTGTGRTRDGGTGNRYGSDVASSDPLLGGKLIPKQDIPIPGRNDRAESKDPLLYGSVSSNDRREPFRLTPESTNAALAGKGVEDVPRLDDRRKSEPGKGPVPFKPPTESGGALTASIPNVETQFDQLRTMNAVFNRPIQDKNGDFFFTAEVQNADGRVQRFEGTGISASAAVNQVLEQIRNR
jgi:hypothetical protein